MTKKELKEFIRDCLLEQDKIGKPPVKITQIIGPTGPDYGPGSGEYPNYDWNKNPMGLDKNNLSDPRVLRRLPPKSQWIRNHAVEPLRPPNYPGETAGGTSIRMQPDVSRSMNDYEIEKRRIAISNQKYHREKAAKEREDAIKSDAEFKRKLRIADDIGNMLLIGSALAAFGALAFSMISENDNVQSDLESGKEVTVKSPNIDGKTSEERAVLAKLKPKIPSHFKVKYNPNLGKKVDLDFKKVMVTVSDLNLAKSLVNAKTDLNEDSTSTDVSLKDLIKIAKTQGVDGLKKAAEKIVST